MRVRLYDAFTGKPVRDADFTFELVAQEMRGGHPDVIQEIYDELRENLKWRGRTSLGPFYEVRRIVPAQEARLCA